MFHLYMSKSNPTPTFYKTKTKSTDQKKLDSCSNHCELLPGRERERERLCDDRLQLCEAFQLLYSP